MSEQVGAGPRLRGVLGTVPVYVPGAPPAPGPDGRAYKLSSNENPYPPLPGVTEALVRAAGDFNRYPDAGATRLYTALSERLGVPADHLAVGPGAVAVLEQAVRAAAGAGDEVVFAWRSFEAYPIMVGLSGATPVTVPLTADGHHDLDAMAAAITPRTRAVLVCSPNNPTGTFIPRPELERFLDRVPSDVLVVLDEAYREFAAGPDWFDGAELLDGRPNLVVVRTFSKAYGLAGLRVGYAVGAPPVAEALRKTATPFGVTQLAQEAAVASLAAEDELLARVAALVEERERVVKALAEQGWALPESRGNFVWLELGERTGEFAERCRAAGLSVRPFAGEGVRVTVAESAAMDVFLRVAAEWRRA
nr:histidinol-phosphate transaminase [Allostreptomyces psammosilenae]